MTIDEPNDLMKIERFAKELGGEHSPVSNSTVWRKVKSGEIPPPIRLGSKSVRFRKRWAAEFHARQLASRNRDGA